MKDKWLCSALAVVMTTGAIAADWKPTKNVEIVVPFAAGGGNDVPARVLQKLLTEKRIVDAPVTVVNKPGGGGTLGLLYLNQHVGDAHYLSLISTSTLTSHIIGSSTINYTDVTPLIPLVVEYIGFAVNPTSSIQTFRELAERMKKDPTSLSFAVGGGLGNPNHTAIAAALKAAGADARKMKAVAFGGGKEAMTAVLGGHVDVLSAATSVLAPQAKAGKLRVIAVAAPTRLEGDLAAVPTLKEQRTPGVLAFSRYIVAPKGATSQQVSYWQDALSRAIATPEWRAEADKHDWDTPRAAASATSADLAEQYQSLKAILTDLGMAK